jgi:hypothetical protein
MKRRPTRLRLIVALIAGASVFFGVSPAHAGGTLRIAMTAADVPTTTGMPDNGYEGVRFFGYPVFESLVLWDLTRADVLANIRPGLAERWEITSDGRVYTFSLRTNAQWSTGPALSTADVVYSWRRVLEPTNACQYANLLFPVLGAEDFHRGRIPDFAGVGVRELGPHTLRVELQSPCAYFLDLCALDPRGPRQAIERHGDRWMPPPPGQRPYELDFWRLNDRRLRRNALLGRRQHTSAIIDLSPYRANTVLNLYLKGQPISWDKPLVPELMPSCRCRFHSFPILGTYFSSRVTRNRDDPRVFAPARPRDRHAASHRRITASGEEPYHMVPTVTPTSSAARASATIPPGPGASRRRRPAEGRGFPRRTLIDSSVGGPARVNERTGVELRPCGGASASRSTSGAWRRVHLVAQRAWTRLSRSSWIGDYNDRTFSTCS